MRQIGKTACFAGCAESSARAGGGGEDELRAGRRQRRQRTERPAVAGDSQRCARSEKPRVSLDAGNPPRAPAVAEKMNFEREDANDDNELNDLLWRAIRKDAPDRKNRVFRWMRGTLRARRRWRRR